MSVLKQSEADEFPQTFHGDIERVQSWAAEFVKSGSYSGPEALCAAIHKCAAKHWSLSRKAYPGRRKAYDEYLAHCWWALLEIGDKNLYRGFAEISFTQAIASSVEGWKTVKVDPFRAPRTN